MGIITKLVDAIDDESIRNHIDHEIDKDFTYCGDWEVEMEHVNLYLNKLLLIRLDVSDQSVPKSELKSARQVLQVVERERFVNSWISDLKELYFPVLEKVW